MRTKALILTAAISVAGLVNSVAQVYSVNVVGYVNLNLKSGFNLICNPLMATGGSAISAVIPSGVDDFTTVYAYVSGAFADSTYIGGAWSNPDLNVGPGVGFFISISADKTLTFVGEVAQNADSNMAVPAGWALIGSKVPQSAALDTLGFPLQDFDTVYMYRNGAYADATWLGGAWSVPDNATPAIGEGFWSSKAAAGDWNRNFQVQ
jgi:hypothetical protein